ncbi:prepilin peptidase [Szabonella alba]|uniref:Prepilin peptidase n=1 Tax=Szabonella alba TaxID=2804194 RepID=A0A8K0VAQ1_9RHOB|nr:prepilin peptidase [Szabonella alba]MBL4916445.1 prepilin peptidase [Szabonella alba]
MTASAALWFLPFTLVIGLWVAWSDMKTMKIPNRAVLALLLVYLIIGPLALPFQIWLWGWVVGLCVLLSGFVLNAAGAMGGGDAKFSAAMALIMAQIDLRVLAVLTCATVLGAFATHRIFGLIPALRRRFAWDSWDRPGFPLRSDFPMGLALAGILNFYLLFTILPQF